MTQTRRHSREYLATVLDRRPSWLDVARHFAAFTEVTMLRLRVARGKAQRGVLGPDSDGFMEFLRSGDPAMMGTFHVGHSDLVGFLFGGQEQRRVFMIRHRVGNSADTDELERAFGKWVSYIWVNDGQNLVFALKNAVAEGGSIALKCDRLHFSAKTEAFHFLGARRVFPFTLYHLGMIFDLPVILSVGFPGEAGQTVVHSAPRWDADRKLSRDENLARAREHFQAFLTRLENLLRQQPYLWFNFIELNPAVQADEPAHVSHRQAAQAASELINFPTPRSRSHVVLIPTYNAGPLLIKTVQEALRYWKPVWVVVDGSTDGSEKPLLELEKQEPDLRVIQRAKNGGKGSAVLTGVEAALKAGFTHVLTMDSDGQHSAAHIPPFMAASREIPSALIAGVPQFGDEAPRERLAGHRLCVKIARLETLGAGAADPLFGFRVYPAQALRDALTATRTARGFDFDPEIAVRLSWSGTPTRNIPAPCRYLSKLEGGVSHFQYGRDNVKMVRLHARLFSQLLWHWPALRRTARKNRQLAQR